MTATSAFALGGDAWAQTPAPPSRAWGFVTAKVDSRFSHYIYIGYGYDAVFVVGALLENPRTGYTEQIVGLGARLSPLRGISQSIAIAFCNASDSQYLQLYYLPSRAFGRVAARASVEAYLPMQAAGIPAAISSLVITARVYRPVAASIVYEMSAAQHALTSHSAGIGARIDVPHAEIGIDAMRGIAHEQDHARLIFRAFY